MLRLAVHRRELDDTVPAGRVLARSASRIHTLVVARSPSELDLLRSALSEIQTLEIVGAADSTASAVDLLEQCQPELIVIDHQSPVEMVLKILESQGTEGNVAFGAVLEGVGLRTFNVASADPEEGCDGRSAGESERAAGDGKRGILFPAHARKLSSGDPIILKLNDKYHVVRVRSILSVSAARHYTCVVTQEGFKGIASRSMRDWEDRLPANTFVRVHRNTIINLECVEHIDPSRHSTYNVYLKGIEKPVPMSHRCFARIKRQFN